MTDQYPSHEHVGVAAAIGAFLFSIYAFFRRSRKEMYARIDRKAEASDVSALGDRIEHRLNEFERRNDEAHERIYQNLLMMKFNRGRDDERSE